MYRKKNSVYIGFDTIPGIRSPQGVLEHIPHRQERTAVLSAYYVPVPG